MQNQEKRVVFCDLGGVGLSLIDMRKWWEKLFWFSLRNPTKFETAKKIALEVAWEPFERGEISPGEFQILFQKILGLTSMHTIAFWNFYVNIFERVNAPFVECLHAMRERGVILALLSNADKERHEYFRKDFPDAYKTVTDPFHYLFFSHQIGSRKPEPKIYRHAFREVSALPQNAFYLDDFEPNIIGMADAIPGMPRENMHLYHADRHDDATAFFRRHNLIA